MAKGINFLSVTLAITFSGMVHAVGACISTASVGDVATFFRSESIGRTEYHLQAYLNFVSPWHWKMDYSLQLRPSVCT